MVLSVPPLLEELGQDNKVRVRQALAAWQGELWDAVQRLRERDEPALDARWMGTVEQLSSVIGGSVVVGGEGESPDVVPLPSAAVPAVKGSQDDPLVRLEGAPTHSGRYALLSVVIGSSMGIWPAVLSVGEGGGAAARDLRDEDGRPVEMQVFAPTSSRISFRLVDAETRAVVSTSDSIEELALGVKQGPRPVPWAEFLEGCLWGLPSPAPAFPDCTLMVANGPHMRAMGALWGLEQLRQAQLPLLAPLGFLAAATELPEARALANELAESWAALTNKKQQPSFDGAQLLLTVEQLLGVMLPAAGTEAALRAAIPAQALDAVSAALYLGEALLRSVSAAETAYSTTMTTLDAPRARRSLGSATAGAPTYLTKVAQPATSTNASPARARQTTPGGTPKEIDSDGDEVLTPVSMRKELKRLRQMVPAGVGSSAAGKKAARNTGGSSSTRVTGLPRDLVDLSEEVRPVACATGQEVEHADRTTSSIPGRPRLLADKEPARTGAVLSAGPTMAECLQMQHTAEVMRLIPASADATPLRELSVRLSEGGLQDAPAAFAQAASTVATGITPGVGTALEAEMLADNIAAVLDDLVVARALPTDHPAFSGGVRPADWTQAAARGRALILATSRAFRSARQVGASSAVAGSVTAGLSAKPEKVPEDAYTKVHEATTNSLKALAASAGILNSLTTDAALRGEKLRGSPFEALTGHTKEELDAALPGELDYFVGMYGQAATAYLVSNSRSREEVSGRGVPVSLVGIRWHLWLRALRWVCDAYGERRATQRRADVEKLALSLLTGAVPSEPTGSEGEKLIIELLGGSKPHRSAEVEREGGSLSTGTVGKLTGDAAQFSIRLAYRRWAKGLARCMGEVLRAARGRHVSSTDVIGPEGDFGVEEALLNVSDDLPAERLRSIGRFLLGEVHVACVLHRSEPAAVLPDIAAIVAEMGGDVFKYRRQEHQLETLAQSAAAKLTEALTERLKAVEARHKFTSPGVRADHENKPKAGAPRKFGASGATPQEERRPGKSVGAQRQTTRDAGKHVSVATAPPAGVEIDDGAVESTARGAARALEDSMKRDRGEPLPSRVQAVAALQADYRKSVGAPPFKRRDDKEPCAWLALAGKCKDKACKSCSSGLSFDRAMVTAVRARCAPGLFDETKHLTKEPG